MPLFVAEQLLIRRPIPTCVYAIFANVTGCIVARSPTHSGLVKDSFYVSIGLRMRVGSKNVVGKGRVVGSVQAVTVQARAAGGGSNSLH